MNPDSTCVNCGQTLTGAFCSACGERSPNPSDLTLGHFFRQAFNAVANFDSRFLKTLRYLLARPGFLAQEYRIGRRLRYVGPLQLFLIINVAYFFVQSYVINVFSTTLNVHIHQLPYATMSNEMVNQTLLSKQWDLETYRVHFDRVVDQLSRSLILLNVPLFALVLALLFRRQKRFAVEHLNVALHFYAWLLIFLPVLYLLCRPFPFLMNDQTFTLMVTAAVGCYVFLCLKRVYGQSNTITGIKAAILAFSLIVVLQCYRLILFFTSHFYTVYFT